MGIYIHEDMCLDLTCTTKSKLYAKDELIFMGDGYKAINLMIQRSNDKQPVESKFSAQLSLRQKPKFEKAETSGITKDMFLKELQNASRGNTSRNRSRKK